MISSNFSEQNKPSSKVLRPPGGGSSDIFGAEMPQTPRSVKNHMQSNIFSSEKNAYNKNNGDQQRRAQRNVDSYSRLFGEAERPITPAKNHMKSNIPFGAKTEAAQKLLSHGNVTNVYNSNAKSSGSVSSASSSVSSSTENLKINILSKTDVDPACPEAHKPNPNLNPNITTLGAPINNDLPCEKNSENVSARSKQFDKSDIGNVDIVLQTRCDSGCNADNPNSLSELSPENNQKDPLEQCPEKCLKSQGARNPITGCGLGEDGVGGIKPKKPKSRRDGNPVTGEGYKSGNDSTSANGANQIINKNRIPPGGFSSGLW